MSSIEDTIQSSLFSLYNLLPIILMITLLTLGIGLGNYGMISILIGQASLAFVVFILRMVIPSDKNHHLFSLMPNESASQFPSMWLTQVFFFMLCLIINANSVMNREEVATGSDPMFDKKVYNRKARCTMIIATCSIMLVLLVGYRCVVEYNSGATWPLLGIVFSLLIGGGGAAIWGVASTAPTIGIKNMDIFGISQQLIHIRQTDIKTMCELVPERTVSQ
jgi:hypothetical protein